MSTPAGIQKTEEIARYLNAVFVAELHSNADTRLPNWPLDQLDLLEECHYASKIIVQAIRNKRWMPWSVYDYLEVLRAGGAEVEKKLQEMFPPYNTEMIERPCVVVDRDGKILLWYLPRIICPKRRDLIWASVKIIESSLKIIRNSKNWRVNGDHFRLAADCENKPGTVSFALAWFQQGRQGVLDIEVAAELRKLAAPAWLSEMGETSALLGGLLRVTNPAEYETGVATVKAIASGHQVAKKENLDDLAKIWTSPYPTVSLMSSRDSPIHRDQGGDYSSMDMLLSVGPYDAAVFSVPGLGFNFWYNSGTVIGLLGRVVQHGAKCTGERLCWAQYLKENVLDSLGIPPPKWVHIQDLEDL